MKEIIKDKTGALNRILSRLAMEKKKAVCALCLIALMVFMWVKVLISKKPQSAAAALQTQQPLQKQSESKLKISFIELPVVKGRNDILTRDFFRVGNWRDFISRSKNQNIDGMERVNFFSSDGGAESAARIAENLKLEAVSMGRNPQAFINNKLLASGDKLIVSDGVDTCECEVVNIKESEVFIRCGQVEIRLKLTQMSSVDY